MATILEQVVIGGKNYLFNARLFLQGNVVTSAAASGYTGVNVNAPQFMIPKDSAFRVLQGSFAEFVVGGADVGKINIPDASILLLDSQGLNLAVLGWGTYSQVQGVGRRCNVSIDNFFLSSDFQNLGGDGVHFQTSVRATANNTSAGIVSVTTNLITLVEVFTALPAGMVVGFRG